MQVNGRDADVPQLFGISKDAANKPKHYNMFTKKFDNNANKLGLRSWIEKNRNQTWHITVQNR